MTNEQLTALLLAIREEARMMARIIAHETYDAELADAIRDRISTATLKFENNIDQQINALTGKAVW